MSVPFSNTHLRVPRGFGNILEGIAREVLRDQPKDIPAFAALYFTALLKEREESGLDPAEWSARLEDRFYNNHSFKNSPNQVKPNPAEDEKLKISEEHEADLTRSDGIPTLTTSKLGVFEYLQENESDGKDETDNITDKYVTGTQMDHSSEMSDRRQTGVDAVSGEQENTEEETTGVSSGDDMIGIEVNEKDDRDVCQSEFEPSEEILVSGLSNVDVCAQELRQTEGKDDEYAHEISTGDAEISEISNKKIRSCEFELNEGVSYSEEPKETEERQRQTIVVGLSGDFKDEDLADAPESSKGLMAETSGRVSSAQTESDQLILHEISHSSAGVREEEDIEKLIVATKYTWETHDVALSDDDGSGISSDVDEHHAKVGLETHEVKTGQQPEEDGFGELSSTEAEKTDVLSGDAEEETGHDTENFIALNTDIGEEEEALTADVEAQIKAMEQEATEVEQELYERSDSNESSDEDMGKLGELKICTPNQQSSEVVQINEDGTDHDNKDLNEEELDDHQDEIETKQEMDDDMSPTSDDGREDGGQYMSDTNQQDNSAMQGETNDLPDELNDENADEGDDGDEDGNSPQNIPETQKNDSDSFVGLNEPVVPDPADRKSGTGPEELRQEDNEKETEDGKDTYAGEPTEDIETEQEGRGDAVTPSHQTEPAHDTPEHMPEGEPKDNVDLEGETNDEENCTQPQEEEDIMDIPLDDPEANKAAAKIQAGFRGHMTRKKIKPADKPEGEQEEEEENQEDRRE
ncbi:hypothetical protein DPEC_G00300730 [Dallia pectoralis]|uniref:Uncharacterized protein n=1 Tax=Dallia pectoralis TaxID=75939 RepID=A0ACC2FGH4_DALPE|nr:hypothetical protein DPEC_G00300730 [Dallia pectoralis]